MKQVVLSLALLAATATAASAQRVHAVKINILSSAIRTGSLFYEHKVTDNTSAQLGVAYTNFRIGDEGDRQSWSGITIMPEYRFYLTGEALDGFYVAPFVRFRSFRLSDNVMEYDGYTNEATIVRRHANVSAYGAGVIAGRQWLLGDRVTLDVYAGPSYNGSSFTSKEGSSADDFDYSGLFRGVGFRSGFTFGVAF